MYPNVQEVSVEIRVQDNTLVSYRVVNKESNVWAYFTSRIVDRGGDGTFIVFGKGRVWRPNVASAEKDIFMMTFDNPADGNADLAELLFANREYEFSCILDAPEGTYHKKYVAHFMFQTEDNKETTRKESGTYAFKLIDSALTSE